MESRKDCPVVGLEPVGNKTACLHDCPKLNKNPTWFPFQPREDQPTGFSWLPARPACTLEESATTPAWFRVEEPLLEVE
jgi:hypothetical protein